MMQTVSKAGFSRAEVVRDIKNRHSGPISGPTKTPVRINLIFRKGILNLLSCINNYMPNNQFKKGELYSFITGKASIAIARRLQKKFNSAGIQLTIEQWSVLYQLWKEDGKSQQELCNSTFRDKPSITRLIDNLEKLSLVKRVSDEKDRRINKVFLTKNALKLQEDTMQLAEQTLNEALEGVPPDQVEMCKEVLQKVYENLNGS
jgi:DNA-binding MarR family transcriptional regulator